MIKTIKSKSALNRKALANGATVKSKSGATFNAGAKKRSVVAKKTVAKRVIEKPDNSIVITAAVEKQTAQLMMALEKLTIQMAEIKSQYKEPITAWDFKIIHNDDGTTDIQARVPDLAISRVIN